MRREGWSKPHIYSASTSASTTLPRTNTQTRRGRRSSAPSARCLPEFACFTWKANRNRDKPLKFSPNTIHIYEYYDKHGNFGLDKRNRIYLKTRSARGVTRLTELKIAEKAARRFSSLSKGESAFWRRSMHLRIRSKLGSDGGMIFGCKQNYR